MVQLASPLLVGVYDHFSGDKLFELVSEEKTSQSLPLLFKDILQDFDCKRILFATGPGSFMAIKIAYIFLRTICLTRGIQLYGVDGFYFNCNAPIKAMKNIAFVKDKNGKIQTNLVDEEDLGTFSLPNSFEASEYDENIEPLYILPAV